MSAETLAERIRERAREWLNKKHFTSDSGVTLDCLAMLPDDHALALTIGQLATIAAHFALSELSAAEQAARKEERELCAKIAEAEHHYRTNGLGIARAIRNNDTTAIRNRE